MSYIKVENVHKSFGKTSVLRACQLEVEKGEQLVIEGASGSGKSTLLYLIGGLDKSDLGQISVGAYNLNQLDDERLALFRNQEVGFIFQFHFLLPSMNCMDNILLPARIGGKSVSDVKKRSIALSKQLGVEHCLKKFPYQISGGEQQRINIIRALSLKPKMLLCDEPTGNLDSANSALVTKILKELSEKMGSTLIIVTHDRRVGASFERKITIEDGQIIS